MRSQWGLLSLEDKGVDQKCDGRLLAGEAHRLLL